MSERGQSIGGNARVYEVARLTGVPAYELRPDIIPAPSGEAA